MVGRGARRRALAAVAAMAVAAASWALVLPGTARADTAPTPVTATDPVTVSADALPTVQINGVVWSQVVVGSTVYVAGSFSRARPAGAPVGTNETVRNNFLAYDIRTGELITSFAPDLNAQARAVAASPDGTRVYVGGDFTTANGQVRNRVAAYDTATGALVGTFRPSVNGQVGAIAATNSTVYLGGSLSGVGGVSRTRLAAVRASDGGLLPWAPVPGPGPTTGNVLPLFDSNNKSIPNTRDPRNSQTSVDVQALIVTGGGTQVVAAGRFHSMNGARATGVAALDPTSGANRTFAVNQLINNQGVNSAIWSLSTDGTNVYGTGYDYYGPGNVESSFAASVNGGQLQWYASCRGDTYSSFPMNGALYMASHAHQCVNQGGFPEQNPSVWKYATAVSLAPHGRVGNAAFATANFAGKPAPALLSWYPTFAQGTFTGQYQAGWNVTGNSQYLVYGGEFPRVNGQNQQGLVRFAVPAIAPNKVGPTVTPGVSVVPTASGPRVGWQGSWDQDNRVVTYRVYRDNGTQPVATFTRAAAWWQTGPVAWVDRSAPAGSHTYRVVVNDPFGNEVTVGTATGSSAGPSAARAYARAVHADGASDHWSLGERSGATSYDAAGVDDLIGSGGLVRGWAGGIRGDADTATWFDGIGSYLSTQTPRRGLNTFTVEAWFETRSTAGGKIVGFGDQRTGLSSNFDRMLWLDPAGKLHFAVWPGFNAELVTPTAYNNGQWHHAVASVSPTGMQLFVDGRLVVSRTDVVSAQEFTGYWRVGGDSTWSGSRYFNGRIDEVAVYPTVLTAGQVAGHYAIGTTGTAANVAPTASFTATAQGLSTSVDGRLSVDPDGGAISQYRWDFGDGTTGTGVTATHAYTRSGTFTVRLTVTDAAGATGSTERQVTVVEPANEPPTAAFTSTSTDLTAAVDARSSGDPDGTVASYTWAWGDSTPNGAGATAAHTYSAAGTYQVTLTVTDDDGASSKVTRAVVVTAPGTARPLASDGFARSVTGGLGTADLGGAWTAAIGASRQSVSGGAAVLGLPGAGNDTGAYLGAVSTSSADVRTSFTLSSAPTGSGTYVYVTGRRVGPGNEYTVRARVAPDGGVWLAMSRVAGAVESFPGGEVLVPGLTWTPGKTLELRVQVTGTGTMTVTGSVWAAGQAEPATPQLSRTDATAALQAPGGVGIGAYRPGNATAATSVRFGPLVVTPVGAAPPPPPPANTPPAAAFTATPSDLAVAVDGRGSADADGSVVGYAWNWGDGTATASGATASHTYAVAGTYTVTLTVTDDDGATATTTRSVVVTAPGGPPQPVALAADAFERSGTGGLGTADVGGAWTTLVGAVRQAVTGGTAVLTVGPGNNAGSHLAAVSQAAADVRTTVSFSRTPANGTGAYAFVTGRRVGTAMYNARVRVLPGGEVGVALIREVDGGETILGPVVTLPGLTYTPDLPLSVHLQVTGTGTTNLELTVWPAGAAEPTAPTLVRTDSTAVLQTAGSVGLAAYLSGSSTSPVAVRFDDLRVTAPR